MVNNIEIEFCSGCHGVYFDPGEMALGMPGGNWLKPESDIDKGAIAAGFFEILLAFFSP